MKCFNRPRGSHFLIIGAISFFLTFFKDDLANGNLFILMSAWSIAASLIFIGLQRKFDIFLGRSSPPHFVYRKGNNGKNVWKLCQYAKKQGDIESCIVLLKSIIETEPEGKYSKLAKNELRKLGRG